MFFCDGGTWPQAVLPKRRTFMQLELFPTARPLREQPPVLARLNLEERRALIRTLARLLVKTIRPPTKGASYER